MRRPGSTRIALALGLLSGFLSLSARPALAHSELLESRPAYGATVAQPPGQLFLRFSKRLDLSYAQLDLRGPQGPLKVGKPTFGDGRTSVKVPTPKLGAGSFTLTYWMVAEDSHVMGGEVLFSVAGATPEAAASRPSDARSPGAGRPLVGSVPSPLPSASTDAVPAGAASGPAGPTPAQIPRALTEMPADLGGIKQEQAAAAAPRYVTTVRAAPLTAMGEALAGLDYAFLAILVGGGAFLALAWPAGGDVRKARLLLWGGLIGAFISTIAAVAVKVASLSRLAVEGSLHPSVASGVFGTWFGRASVARLVLLLLAVPLLLILERRGSRAVRSGGWRNAGVVLGLLALTTHGAFGHAATGNVGRTVGLVHLAAITMWIGGLVVLGVVVMPRRQGPELLSVVPRFSRMAMTSVAAMSLSGGLLLLLVGPNWGRLLGSDYGKALLTKFCLIGLMLGAAHLSRKFTQQRLLVRVEGAPAGRRGHVQAIALGPFVTSVGLEIILAAAVLAMTAILTNQPPPA